MDNQPKQSQSKLKKKVANFVIDFTKELGRGQFGKVYGALNTGNN
jgi:hypothetical protein